MSFDLNKLITIAPNHGKEIINNGTEVPVMDVANANAEVGMQALLDAVDRGCKQFTTDFYVDMSTRQEALDNVFRHQFDVRLSCPTPRFDHSVFRYTRKDGKLDYLWTLPIEDACIYLKNNAWLVDKEEHWLLSFVLQYYSGALLRTCKQLNGEKVDSVALESGSQLEGAQTVILSEKE